MTEVSGEDSLELAKSGAPPRLAQTGERISAGEVSGRDRAAAAAEAKFRESAFASGQVLGGRYRIISRLGVGGMGEVFRAEDLVLGQEVALKFIADVLSNDPASRERLATEVRTARRVSHPNVCRVHDLGDLGGRRFITMEYIDGEDLGTLLRRIGRLPADKGLEIARQIGEALQAAHDQDVLHRDLKPSNVLIDGKGVARLVDFGLAALSTEVKRGDGTLIGTPAYMAPEQLATKPCSVKSEIYAFGLIVYQILTGKPVFAPRTLDELYDLHKQPKVRPIELVPELDPAIDEVVMRCLEEDPEQRPESISQVLAALPGLDPIARAMAAGQTPSPQLLARSGACHRMSPVATWVSLTLILLGLLAAALLMRRAALIPQVPLEKPLAALDDRAQTILNDLGYKTKEMHRASDFDIYERLLWTFADKDHSPERWARVRRDRPAPIDYWYRQGVLPLTPSNPQAEVTMWDPPHAVAGMEAVRLDPRGRLRELAVVTEPSHVNESPGAGSWLTPKAEALPTEPVNGRAPCDVYMFKAAGLDIDQFNEVSPTRIPPMYVGQRRAWLGVYPENQDEPIRVEIGTLGSHVVTFRIIETKLSEASSWATPALSPQGNVGRTLIILAEVIVLVGGALLAWRNMHQHKGDIAGANKVAGVVAGLLFLSDLLLRRHSLSPALEAPLFRDVLQVAISRGVVAWVGYLALEPVVRRLWPRTLVAWSRVLAGKYRDPMMGRCVLAGVGAGAACTLVMQLGGLAPGWLGQAPPIPMYDRLAGVDALLSMPHALGAMLAIVVHWIGVGMVFVLGLGLMGLVVPGRRAATVLYATLAVVAWTLSRYAYPGAGPWWSLWLTSMLVVSIAMFVVVRLGLLAAVIAGVTFNLLIAFPVPDSTSMWYWGLSTSAVVGIAAFTCLGAYIASVDRQHAPSPLARTLPA
ncbi:MAG: protein kinase [Tepidisphaera sp.]|nr:protein kinase [Tepidisphaera sp.]